jgi:hypothetical protein
VQRPGPALHRASAGASTGASAARRGWSPLVVLVLRVQLLRCQLLPQLVLLVLQTLLVLLLPLPLLVLPHLPLLLLLLLLRHPSEHRRGGQRGSA